MKTKTKTKVSTKVKVAVALGVAAAIAAAGFFYITAPKINYLSDSLGNTTSWSYQDYASTIPGKGQTWPQSGPALGKGQTEPVFAKGTFPVFEVVPGQQITVDLGSRFRSRNMQLLYGFFEEGKDDVVTGITPDLNLIQEVFLNANPTLKKSYTFTIPEKGVKIGGYYTMVAGLRADKNKPAGLSFLDVDDYAFLRYLIVNPGDLTGGSVVMVDANTYPVSSYLVGGKDQMLASYILTNKGSEDVAVKSLNFYPKAMFYPKSDILFSVVTSGSDLIGNKMFKKAEKLKPFTVNFNDYELKAGKSKTINVWIQSDSYYVGSYISLGVNTARTKFEILKTGEVYKAGSAGVEGMVYGPIMATTEK